MLCDIQVKEAQQAGHEQRPDDQAELAPSRPGFSTGSLGLAERPPRMQTKWKLAILELISGLLGWVWIVAGLAAGYFLVAVIFLDGAWSWFFWSTAISVTAKSLAGGFRENQQRVAFEAELVSEAHSPTQARQERVERILRESRVSSSEHMNAAEAEAIIRAYGAVLVNSAPPPGTVADKSRLPVSKSMLKEAIMFALGATKDPIQKSHLRIAYLQLADFQEGVGAVDVALDVSRLDLQNATPEELAQQVIEQTEGTEELQVLVQKEQEMLKQELQAAGHWSSEP